MYGSDITILCIDDHWNALIGRKMLLEQSGYCVLEATSADEGLSMLPGEENLRFVRAGALAATGDTGSAVTELRRLMAARLSWEIIIRSFAAQGLMTLPPPALKELLG